MLLKEKLAERIPRWKEELTTLAKQHGEKVIGSVTVSQALGGMRGIKGLLCDTSEVDPDTGLVIRGFPILELTEKLPEEVFHLLLTGELPTPEELADLQGELRARSLVPAYIWKALEALPHDTHPMCLLNTAILAMQGEAVFHRKFQAGMGKAQYWEATLEDALNLVGKFPTLAAGVFRLRYRYGRMIPSDPSLDWAADYVRMLGLKDPREETTLLMRLNLVLHCDHESGNVSSLTAATVNSALSDLYYAVSAGLNGLAGPLHGLANQECLNWILKVKKDLGGVPSDEVLRKFAWDTLKSGRVIPGYGHAVLRITDPRFTALLNFGKKYCNDDPVFQLVEKCFRIVPEVLREQGKAKDPWPNVDAVSGALLYHYDLVETSYYTVLFSISRVLGITAQAVINRALDAPLIRPKSVTTAWLKKAVNA